MKIPQKSTGSLDDSLAKAYKQLGPDLIYSWPGHHFIKRNGELQGSCPFHSSKSKRSFKVTIETGEWYCFGCSTGGGPIQYRWKLAGGDGTPEGDDFRAIADELFDQAEIDSPLTEGKHDEDIRRRRAALEILFGICHKHLTDEAREYWHRRGLDDQAIESFQLGWYPDFEIVARELNFAGFDRDFCQRAKLLAPPMVHYCTVPWRDSYGRPLTLYGCWPGDRGDRPHKMALGNPGEDGQEWLRTKESPFLLDRALKAGHQQIVIVEGVIDALVAHAHGDDRVVAVVAASPSYDQAARLKKRRITTATIALDPDSAGDKGIESSVRILSQAGIVTAVAQRLPDGQDPDDFILTNGIDAWRAHTAKTTAGWGHLAQQITVDSAAPDSVKLAAFDKFMAEITDLVQRLEVMTVISELTGVDLDIVKERFRNELPQKTTTKSKVKPPKPDTKSAESYTAIPAENTYRRPVAMAPLPIEVLPGIVRDYLLYAAATCSCEPAAPFMHVIALAAGLIGNTHRIELAPEFVEPSVLWTVTIGSSGKGKTPPFRAVMGLIKPLEEYLQEFNAAQKEAFTIEKAHHALALKVWQKKPNGDPPPAPERPPVLTVHSTDSTIEGLAWMHQNNWRGLTFTRSELSGWIESFGAYTGAKGRDLSQWLELHDGSTLKVDRKGADPETGSRTIYVPLTSVSLTGTIQPRVMKSVFGDRAHDSGLVARILTIWPQWEFTPWQGSDARQAQHYADSYRAAMEELLRKLYELQPAEDGRGRPTPHIIRLSRDAEAVWEPFYNSTRKRSFTFDEDDEAFLANAWPKLLGAAARIALVIHGIRKAIGEPVGDLLDAEDMQAGVMITEWLKKETERVFDLMYRTPAERELDMILELVDEAGGKLTPRELTRRHPKKYAKTETAEAALDRVVKAGLATWEVTSGGRGRPSRYIELRR